MRLDDNNQVPDGDVVVSRINLYPDYLPDDAHWNAPAYWVIDHYGANTNLGIVNELRLADFRDMTSADANQPSLVNLFARDHNADGNSWNTPVADANECIAATDELVFENPPLTDALQLAIVYQGAFPNAMNPLSANNAFMLYPVPVAQQGVLTLKASVAGSVQFVLYDELGSEVLRHAFTTQAQLPLRDLPAGFYSYRFIAAQQIQNGHLLVQ
jgi:hypothetical protein